ncbi:MAG: sodium:solute symporter family protein, partial [Clostridia bacterium]|nr:sodium:solute symporter family protein [Clostridia bacterium]
MFANVSFPLLVVVVLAYIAALLYMGRYAARQTKTSADYMVAGRQMNAFLMAMAYGATFISTSAIVGFGGQAAANGMSLLWLSFANIVLGILFAFIVLGTRTRALGQALDVRTLPDLLGRRYNSNFIQSYAGAVIAIMMPIYAAAVLIGGARFLEGALAIPYWLAYVITAAIVGWYVF